ncbi:MAG: hypothetical protein JKY61_01890 [Planctomycetes bacterium]|nr:hypothetical protein [Planctomycetota bacterium]
MRSGVVLNVQAPIVSELETLNSPEEEFEFVYGSFLESKHPDDPDLGTLRYNLGNAFGSNAQHEKAAPLFRESWKNDTRSFGEHQPYSHMSQLGYARTLLELQRAEDMKQQSIEGE